MDIKNPDAQYIDVEGGKLAFTFPYNRGLIDVIKSTFKWSSWNGKKWTVFIHPINLRVLVGFARDWGFDLSDDAFHLVGMSKSQSQLDGRLQCKDQSPYQLRVTKTLMPFQEEGVRYILDKHRVLLADDMGLGKTLQAITAVAHVKAFPAVVVVKGSLIENWKREIEDTLPDVSVNVPTKAIKNGADFIIISSDKVKNFYNELLALKPLAIIIDEVHKTKNLKSERFKNILRLCISCHIRILISGTLVLNKPSDLIGPLTLLEFLNPEFGGFMNFVTRYCDAKSNGFGLNYDGHSNLEELNKRLTDLCMIRRLKSQVNLGLPDKIRHNVYVDLSNRNEYEETFRRLTGGKKMKKIGLELYEKLSLVSAEGKLDYFLTWAEKHIAEGKKLLVFAFHTSILEKIAERLNCGLMDGGTPVKQRDRLVTEFQHNPEVMALALNIKTGAEGFTLTASSTVAFLEGDFVPNIIVQCEDRAHRIGQTKTVNCYSFIGRQTVDETVFQIAENKKEVVAQAMDSHNVASNELFELLLADLQSETVPV